MNDQRTAVVAVVAVVLLLGLGVSLALAGLFPWGGGLGADDTTTTAGPSGDGTSEGADTTTATSATDGTAADSTVDDSGDTTAERDTTATDTATSTAPTDTATDTADEATPVEPYAFRIDSIEECGTTCREVTATLTNTGGERRTGVVVTTKLVADGDVIWEGDQNVGTFEPGESMTETREVDVGFTGAYKIQQNDGYVTIRTIVHSDQGTVQFEERRKVA